MRVTNSAPAVVRSSETQNTAAARPAVAAESKKLPQTDLLKDKFIPFPFKPADAKTRAKQGEQLHEIADGVRNGSLTEKEASALMKEQEAIANAQREAMADGKLTLGEKLKLSLMQGQAERHIDGATGNSSRDLLARFDKDAQRQAGQIDQIANGRTNGNITNFEAGKLLGQQASIADTRGNSGPGSLGNVLTDLKQAQAQKDIDRHSKPGTQLDISVPLPPIRKTGVIFG